MDSLVRWRHLTQSTSLGTVLCSHPGKLWKWRHIPFIFYLCVLKRSLEITVLYALLFHQRRDVRRQEAACDGVSGGPGCAMRHDANDESDDDDDDNNRKEPTSFLGYSPSVRCTATLGGHRPCIQRWVFVTNTNAGNCFSRYSSVPIRNWITN